MGRICFEAEGGFLVEEAAREYEKVAMREWRVKGVAREVSAGSSRSPATGLFYRPPDKI